MRLVSALVICLSAAAVGVAVTNRTGFAQAGDPAIGSWKLNVGKSSYRPGPAPKSGSAVFSAARQGVKVVVEGVAATGDKVHWEYVCAYDGKDCPVTGNNADADMVSLKRVNATTVVTSNKKAGKPTLTNTRVVSADGKTLTVTTKGTNAKGQTVNNVQVYEKS